MSLREREITHSLFLAGGRGQRIEEITLREKLPKQLLPVKQSNSLYEGLNAVKQAFPSTKIVIISSPRWQTIFAKALMSQGVVLIQEYPWGNADAIRIALDTMDEGENILCCNADNLFGLRKEELLKLSREHQTKGNEVTILLEEVSNQKSPYVWLYNNQNKLLGRVRRQELSSARLERPEIRKGIFCGIFVAQLAWLRKASEQECRLAIAEKREAKITNMILREEQEQVGVCPTKVIHYGINTPADLAFLRSKENG